MAFGVIAERFYKEDFLEANGFSRQFLYKKRKSLKTKEDTIASIIEQVLKIRKKHKNMGARVLYHQLNIQNLGVNKFEHIVSSSGLSVVIRKRRIVTTTGVYEKSDQNLINGLLLNGINQVIAGDITYLILQDKTYYIFTLKDMYSKRIVGLYASEYMLASNAIITLKQVLRLRGTDMRHCIHHSDAGSQYKSIKYKKLLKNNQMLMSIANNCLENGMSEQLNGVLKNDYVIKDVKNINQLNKHLTEIKRLINEERPVKDLNYKTPIAFENWIATLDHKPEMQLYDFRKAGDFVQA